MGVGSLVFGILSLISGGIGFLIGPLAIIGVFIGILGIIFGAVGKRKHIKCSTGGLVCSILGTIFNFIPATLWMLIILGLSAAAQGIN